MTETIDPDRRLGELVRDAPELARVLETLGIDYCCGGDRTLREACAGEAVDVSTVRDRLADARGSVDAGFEWETLSELVDGIVSTHHEYLREELPELEELVGTVRSVHGERHPELRELEREVVELAEEMRSHTREEEQAVFPLVQKLDRGDPLTEGEAATLCATFEELEADHEATARHLERIAEVTDDYAVPDDACPSYRSMLDRLEALERDTHRHVHRENNVLFVEAEDRLAVP